MKDLNHSDFIQIHQQQNQNQIKVKRVFHGQLINRTS